MSEKFTGKVVWFKMGYGFIAPNSGGEDVFVHFTDIVGQDGFKNLRKDDSVEYEIGKNNRGQPKAVEVKVLK